MAVPILPVSLSNDSQLPEATASNVLELHSYAFAPWAVPPMTGGVVAFTIASRPWAHGSR